LTASRQAVAKRGIRLLHVEGGAQHGDQACLRTNLPTCASFPAPVCWLAQHDGRARTPPSNPLETARESARTDPGVKAKNPSRPASPSSTIAAQRCPVNNASRFFGGRGRGRRCAHHDPGRWQAARLGGLRRFWRRRDPQPRARLAAQPLTSSTKPAVRFSMAVSHALRLEVAKTKTSPSNGWASCT